MLEKFFQKSIKTWQLLLIRIWSFYKHCLQYLHYFWLNRVQFNLIKLSVNRHIICTINSHCKPFQLRSSSTALVQLVLTLTVPLHHSIICSRTPSSSQTFFILKNWLLTYLHNWEQAGFSHEATLEDYRVLIMTKIYVDFMGSKINTSSFANCIFRLRNLHSFQEIWHSIKL